MWLTQHLAYHYVTACYRFIVPCHVLLFLKQCSEELDVPITYYSEKHNDYQWIVPTSEPSLDFDSAKGIRSVTAQSRTKLGKRQRYCRDSSSM